MSRRRLSCALVLLAAAGCARDDLGPATPGRPAAGDVLRPRPHLPEPWTAGKKVVFGAYVEVVRPGRAPFDLLDDNVPEGSIQVTGEVRFYAGDAPLGEARALAFAHEC